MTGRPTRPPEAPPGTPPIEALLAALRLTLGAGEREANAAALARVADWPAVARLARRHRVGPLVHRAARAVEGVVAAEPVLAPLRDRTIRSGLGQLAGLTRASGCLDDAGIPFLVLKGLPLAARLYGTPLARECYDIDLLVPPDAVRDAERALTRAGWRLLKPAFRPTPARLRCYDRFVKDRLFAGPGGPLELHHRLVSNPALLPLAFDDLRANAVDTATGDRRFPTLGDDHLLIYLVVHGQLHRWSRLKWLCDLAALLAAMRADSFAAAVERCRRRGLRPEPLFGPALLLCRDCLHVAPPDADRRPRRAGPRTERAASATRALWTRPGGGGGLRGAARRVDELRAAIAMKPSPRLVAHELARLCAAPYDLGRIDLPDRLFFLYYPLRPVLYLAGRLRRTARPSGQKSRNSSALVRAPGRGRPR